MLRDWAGWQLILSCEHGGNQVPAAYRELLRDQGALLESHRGYDIGALELALDLARRLEVPLCAARVTRLLVDLNRSPHNRRALFSEFSRTLSAREQETLLADHYRPYRARVETLVAERLEQGGCVVHLAVHSFTPVFNGVTRPCDLGLLYDPRRAREASFCRDWQQRLHALAPELRIRRNYPYRGRSDALVTWLRCRLPAQRYLGLELEINQALALAGGSAWREIRKIIALSLAG
ncbi:N-formylglutamate amidohydrolase [Geoalkalibacter halelectricus]|uniref:N-formylglutamate amidohydrolase n=1 Tax=Geoalkalibacter halelectricus TaxID=2847045 RepID=UPI003D262CF4